MNLRCTYSTSLTV